MKAQDFLKNLTTLHALFEKNEDLYHSLYTGVQEDGDERKILDSMLDVI